MSLCLSLDVVVTIRVFSCPQCGFRDAWGWPREGMGTTGIG